MGRLAHCGLTHMVLKSTRCKDDDGLPMKEDMKVVILAGGLGSRLSEETDVKPKPMVEIGGKPILWHILQHYSSFGFNEFVLALGYRGDVIKRYILEYTKLIDNLTIKLRSGDVLR